VLILGILGGIGAAVYSLSDDANELITSLPDAARKLRDSLQRAARRDRHDARHRAEGRGGTAEGRRGGGRQPRRAGPRGVPRVIVEKPRFDLRDYLWTGTLGLASVLGSW
jgi:hypothetical protein